MPENNTTKPETESSIEIVARNLIAVTYRTGREIAWEDYPELCERDWDAVVERADEIVKSIDREPAVFDAAYALLAARASVQEPQP